MWKFQDFAIMEILCEINFVDSRRAKTAVFDTSWIVNFVPFGNFQPLKSAKFIEIKIQNL